MFKIVLGSEFKLKCLGMRINVEQKCNIITIDQQEYTVHLTYCVFHCLVLTCLIVDLQILRLNLHTNLNIEKCVADIPY